MLGIAKNHLRYESLCRAFKDLQSRFQNLPWLPTLLFGNSDWREVLILSLHYAWSAVLGEYVIDQDRPSSPPCVLLPGWDGAWYLFS